MFRPRSGADYGGNSARVQRQVSDEVGGPSSGSYVHECGNETLERSAATCREVMDEKIGKEEDPGSSCQLSGVVHHQLEDRVDRHHLDSGALVETLQPDSLGRGLPSLGS